MRVKPSTSQFSVAEGSRRQCGYTGWFRALSFTGWSRALSWVWVLAVCHHCLQHHSYGHMAVRHILNFIINVISHSPFNQNNNIENIPSFVLMGLVKQCHKNHSPFPSDPPCPFCHQQRIGGLEECQWFTINMVAQFYEFILSG